MTLAPSQPLANSTTCPPRIVIIGGGFGGLYTALYLQKYRHLKRCSITLIEPRERFLFTPLLYEVLTEEMLLWEVAPAYDVLLAGTNVQWRQDRATHIELAQQHISLQDSEPIAYDYLVVATGAKTRHLPIPGIIEHALTFRSLDDVVKVKTQLDRLAAHPTQIAVTVIGAGASGVELATKVADRLEGRATVRLVDRGGQILRPFARGLQQQAMYALMQRGVDLHLNTQVDTVGSDYIYLNGTQFSSDLTLWATGTEPVPWLGTPLHTNDIGQVWVRPTLQLGDQDNVFVIGDAAVQTRPTPNTAQAAYQAAAVVAQSLANMTRQRRPKSFRYLHLGDMLTLGKGTGGVWSFGISLGGKLGGIVRRIVYLHRLPTNHHRLKVARRALKQLFQSIWPSFS